MALSHLSAQIAARPAVTAAVLGSLTLAAAYLLRRKLFAKAAAKFDATAFQSALNTSALGRVFVHHQVTDSTQLVVKQLVAERGTAAHGTLVLAEEQTSGQGRRGRSWSSPNAENLMFSFAWSVPPQPSPKDTVREFLKLNFAISVATALATQASGAVGTAVKWPNDVWHNGLKLSGMLVDTDGKTTAVAGVGINVNWQIPSGHALAQTATSVSAIVGHSVSRERLLAVFCNHLERLMASPFDSVLAEYRTLDCLLGQPIRIHHNSREVSAPNDYDAVAVDFVEDGGLKVTRADNHQTVVVRGEEVSVRPKQTA